MSNESGSLFIPELEMSSFARNVMNQKYAHTLPDGNKETWNQIAFRVTKNVFSVLNIKEGDKEFNAVYKMIALKKFLPGGRYLYASGRSFHQVQNCLLMRAEDSREGWADIMYKASMALMTGAGIGIDYSEVRPEGEVIKKTGGQATGPIALMKMVNEAGRYIMQGGSRRSAIWAGLVWSHKDIFKFINIKNWSEDIKTLKAKDFNAAAPLDGTNISVILDKSFFDAYENPSDPMHDHAHKVYWETVKQMVSTSEPGFSVNYDNPRESLRNACTEVTSEDDSDICNLGSINMARISSLEEMEEIVSLGTLFLMAGTLYSDVPYEKVSDIRNKNRRLGLGLMGLHEWLLKKGKRYGADSELAEYLDIYKKSGECADKFADLYADLGMTKPIKTRAIAPTGTIGIIAETTTGIEPIFCAAYKRRYLSGNEWKYEYVVDPTVKTLIQQGVDVSIVEDAYSLSYDVERRVHFQAWVQQYVDHSISSTINLPSWGSENNNENTMVDFGKMLMKYLPKIRGITCYADGSRVGQPLNPVSISTALEAGNQVFYESSDSCDITKGGTCGN